ncbi:hypothetical protein BD410DRAFT_770293 [Rickenella mellea]|uniref:Peptidase M1 leukotriene A4 hydrolase/aminopeptidase C-terminal domain-containing protein n=1 Tax=Rickenella mellea TaxID=50990 RepID=A0A4Y7Q3W8_9AGAM|nr:hypothetical protein BD410DRAFT_770293 [Rickenella mellea]
MPDPTTQSNYLSITTEHVAFEWKVDFAKKVISGSALHTMKVHANGVKEALFDTSDLHVSSVETDGASAKFELQAKHDVMGSALRVLLNKEVSDGTEVKVKVFYETSQNSTALQWLEKEQTQGKEFPYLFSQCQPIYARALAPLQDTPSVKLTYSASVTSVLPVLLSAIRKSPPSDGPPHGGKVIGKDLVTYTYDQPTGIPSYLIAIACGDVVYRPFPKPEGKTWSTGIWAEPQTIDAAYWEFSEDTAKFLAAEEKVVVPYKFGVYDLLVLPPSFPYGGMENACLSFLTPISALLAGDRTLVDVVVHELTHSWFGNGVTHTDATHFWLNEGWTTYMERVLQQVLHSPAHRGFSYLIGSKSLQSALKQFESRPKYQRLVIDFDFGEDPDDAYSTIPYEKGSNLLLYLERKLGGLDVFLPYVKDYVNTFMGQSINTSQWKAHLYDYWRKQGDNKIEALDSIDWEGWFHGEGPSLPVEMEYDMTLAKEAYALAEKWDSSRNTADPATLHFKSNDLDGFDSNQKVVFLERLQSYPSLPAAHVNHLGKLYSVATTSNAEIRFRFYELALDPSNAGAKSLAQEAAKWVIGDDGTGILKGRMKFCRPVLRAVNRVDPQTAKEAFTKSKMAFHPIARKLIEKDLSLV